MSKEQASATRDCFISPNVPDSNFEAANVVDVIAGLGHNISNALDRLGTNRANTGMGAIELLSLEIKNGCEAIAGGLHAVAEAIERSKGQDA